MSDEELAGEEQEKSIRGEGEFPTSKEQLPVEVVIVEKNLTFEEASRCLNTLGKDESGMRYAYLMITATDRKLTNISTILNFKHVLFVDVSGNFLTLEDLQVLVEMPYMIVLKAERNRVESAALSPMPFLQVLGLNQNQIMESCNINQPMLEFLELNFNQIYTAQFDTERLIGLKQLEMRGNYLPDIGGNYPPSIENLYLAQNRISKIIPADISKLVNLKRLHLRENHIRKLDGFTGYLENLSYLNLRQNKIRKFRQFAKLKCLPNLKTLIIMQNPVAGDLEETGQPGEGAEEEDMDEEAEKEDVTRIPLLVLLPNLGRINKINVTLEEREEAREIKDEKYDEIMTEESSDDESDAPTTTDFTTDYTTDAENGDNEDGP